LNPSNLEAAQKAVEIKSDDSDLYWRLGKALAEQGQFDGAIAQYRRVLDRNSDSWEAQHYLGEALAKLGRWDEAIDAYDRCVKVHPNDFMSYAGLGDVGWVREFQRGRSSFIKRRSILTLI
jgi:Flp pilus assembly protein TadD